MLARLRRRRVDAEVWRLPMADDENAASAAWTVQDCQETQLTRHWLNQKLKRSSCS